MLGLGGNNLTSDLSVGLRTPTREAERLKEQYGTALSSLIDKDQTIEVPSVGGRKSRKLSRKIMGEILEPRVEEMLSLLNQELVDSGYKDIVNAGIVMTGGTSLLEHMEEMAEQIFDLPVRVGFPHNIGGVTDVVSIPQCATSVGLLIYGMRNEPGRRFKVREENFLGWAAGRMKNWFRSIM